MEQAEAALWALNERKRGKRRYRTREALAARVAAIWAWYDVADLLEVRYQGQVEEREVRGYRGRPPRVERQEEWKVAQVVRREEALAARQRMLGWQVYLTSGGAQGHEMDAITVMCAYHGPYRGERDFQRLKGHPLGITPMDVHGDDHRKGQVRLLSLALRALSLLAYQVRTKLACEGRALPGLYEGNPRRRTARPTAERLLRAFQGLHLTRVRWGEQVVWQVSSLSALQKDILHLLGFSEHAYQSLVCQFPEPP